MWETNTDDRSGRTWQVKQVSNDEAAALRKNHVVGHGDLLVEVKDDISGYHFRSFCPIGT